MAFNWRITERGLWVSEDLIAFSLDDKNKTFRAMRISDKLSPIFYSKGRRNADLRERYFDEIYVFGSVDGPPIKMTFENILLQAYWPEAVGDGMVNTLPIEVLQRLPSVLRADAIDYMIFQYKEFYTGSFHRHR